MSIFGIFKLLLSQMLMTIDIKIYDGNKNIEVGTRNPPQKLR